MSYCEDCGTKIYNGICPNCEFESYIFENQGEYLPDELSDEFINAVNSQNETINNRRKKLENSHNPSEVNND